MPVTPNNMVPVQITRGWLKNKFAEYVFGTPGVEYIRFLGAPGVNNWVYDYDFIVKREFGEALDKLDAELASRNAKYENAWLTDYIITSLTDLKDKLYRLGSANGSGALLQWDDSKRRGTYYDILARTLMLMALEDANPQRFQGELDDD